MLPAIPDHSVDTIICDPPYGTTQCAWDLALDLAAFWTELLRVLKPTGAILMFAAQPFTSVLIQSKADLYRFLYYWQKEKGTNFFRTKYQPLRLIEEIVVFSHGAKYTYHPQMVPLAKPYTHTMPLRHSAITGKGAISDQTAEQREYRTYTHAHPTNLLQFPRDNANKGLVPTQKPVALLEYLVRTFSDAGDVILDPTMGAGTTGVAAIHLSRNFIGLELNPAHYALAKRRIEAEDIIRLPA